jgi:hypothetical protein
MVIYLGNNYNKTKEKQMNKIDLESDNTLAAMVAWNKLSELLDGTEEDQFDDLAKFSSFYSLLVTELHRMKGEDE